MLDEVAHLITGRDCTGCCGNTLCNPITQSRSSCRLQSSYRNRLAVPSVNRQTIHSRSFSLCGPTVWNALPEWLPYSIRRSVNRESLMTVSVPNTTGSLQCCSCWVARNQLDWLQYAISSSHDLPNFSVGLWSRHVTAEGSSLAASVWDLGFPTSLMFNISEWGDMVKVTLPIENLSYRRLYLKK